MSNEMAFELVMWSVFSRNLMEMQSDVQVHKHSQYKVLFSLSYIVLLERNLRTYFVQLEFIKLRIGE